MTFVDFLLRMREVCCGENVYWRKTCMRLYDNFRWFC